MRNYKIEFENRVAFIKSVLCESGLKGIVYGNSGGKDSALVGILCKAACENTVGIILPCTSKRNYDEDTADAKEVAEKYNIETRTVEPGQKMVVNFRGLANSAEKDEKMSIGVEEPRSKKVDNFEQNLTCLPRTQIPVPNPTYRAILIGRRIINYCSSFGREE